MATLRQIFDFSRVDPNPARSRFVKLPQVLREQITPPTREHVEAFLRLVPTRLRLPLVTIEQTALRIEGAVSLTWGRVDEAGSRFLVVEKGRKARWVPVPEWLMQVIGDACPREDRTADRRVFVGLTDSAARGAMGRACKAAGIPHYHPHDLRHRRVSLWHGQGTPLAQIASWAGHSRASFTLDNYVHVMPGDEVPERVLRDLLGAPGDGMVMARRRERGTKPLAASSDA